MTAAVIYFRWPRRTIVLTGPPYAAGRDKEFAELLTDFEGKKVICGGTTANIVSRELGRAIHDDLRGGGGDIPPSALMDSSPWGVKSMSTSRPEAASTRLASAKARAGSGRWCRVRQMTAKSASPSAMVVRL